MFCLFKKLFHAQNDIKIHKEPLEFFTRASQLCFEDNLYVLLIQNTHFLLTKSEAIAEIKSYRMRDKCVGLNLFYGLVDLQAKFAYKTQRVCGEKCQIKSRFAVSRIGKARQKRKEKFRCV